MSASRFVATLTALAALSLAPTALTAPFDGLTVAEQQRAAATFQQYCALCHGADRQGHVNDHAPSLRSKSLMGAGFYERAMTIAYGRRGTPMAGFLDEVGGPLPMTQILQLNEWLENQAGVESVDLPLEPVTGDVQLGATIYARECTGCHGEHGEGIIGPALGNPVMLSLTSDHFLRRAIVNGRDGTPMPAFGPRLSDAEIDAVTAFLRSRATGWSVEKPVYRKPPPETDWVLNPQASAPMFHLAEDMYVSASDLHDALRKSQRMVLLDTRVMSMWQMAHIEGAVPLPYYTGDFDAIAAKLPDDGTWIVAYCECPRAAAESVNRKLRARGFTNTAVLWEGIQGWVSLGYPVARGAATLVDESSLPTQR